MIGGKAFAGGALAAFIAGGGSGYKIGTWQVGAELEALRREYAEQGVAALRAASDIEALRANLARAAEATAAARAAAQAAQARTITREVVRYVQTDNARECGFSADGVRIHDAAARGALAPGGVPEGAAGAAGAHGPAVEIANAEIVPAVVENYATCHAWRNQLAALQEYVRSIQPDKDARR